MAALVFIKIYPLILISLGMLPSVIWLLVYLREDLHPEPKRMIVRIFLWGMLVAPLAVLAQYLVISLIDLQHFAGAAAVGLFSLAAIEEFLKYLVVRTEMEEEPDFNEPSDAIIYMIVSALGFAAVENISIAFSLAPSTAPGTQAATANLLNAVKVLGVRFLGATLLHAFSSSIVGYFLAIHFFRKRGLWTIGAGLGLATALHTLFNYLILQSAQLRGTVFVFAAVGMIITIIALFKNLQKT